MKTNFFDISSYRHIVITAFLISSVALCAQTDSINRSVTVERDFQPVIQAAGKVPTKPEIVETAIDPAPIEYSGFTADITPAASINPLPSRSERFEHGRRYNGYVRGAVGHPNTLFDFGYLYNNGKQSMLKLYAHHRAEWGLATLSKSTVGMDFTHDFSKCRLYFGLKGANLYYYKYGHWYDYSQAWDMWAKNREAYSLRAPLTPADQTALWSGEAHIGVRSQSYHPFQYRIETGYQIFAKLQAVAEHQVRTHADFYWHRNQHHVGANLYVQNNFMQLSGNLKAAIPDSLYRDRHNIRIEPYYEYKGARVRVHVGVNLDMNIGHGQNSLSGTKDLSFAPSPHIRFEAQLAKQWLSFYADISGSHGMGTLQAYMEENRYRLIHAGIIEPHFASYTPVDAQAGFYIRPHRNLLIELHGGYAYMIHEDVWIATADSTTVFAPLNIQMRAGDFSYLHTNYRRGKVGGVLNYHFQDIVRVNLYGDYYFWSGDTTVYDRPNWELGLRVDARVAKHWSLYSDNRFVGKRLALATDGEHILKPIVDLNLGVEYSMIVGKEKYQSPNLSFFLQLNNWLHRKNEIYYGYRSQGINFLLGATYRF